MNKKSVIDTEEKETNKMKNIFLWKNYGNFLWKNGREFSPFLDKLCYRMFFFLKTVVNKIINKISANKIKSFQLLSIILIKPFHFCIE